MTRKLLILMAATLGGLHAAEARAAAPCFGAAARDPVQRCANPGPGLSVFPSPARARTMPNSPCVRVQLSRPFVCGFGARPSTAAATVALVGDSHAAHWRAAIAEIAGRRGWRGLNLTHTSCPFQLALRDLPEPRRSRCAEWKQDVLAWFQAHPEVRTVFVAGLTGGTGVVPAPGQDRFAASVASYVEAWQALPASVERIVVIRDTPRFRFDTDACIERALARRRRPDLACALPRGRALDRDPAVAAASRMAPERVQAVDLTRLFCDERSCYPVIGGALVVRDNTHLTGVFSATLGPFLLRAVERAGASSARRGLGAADRLTQASPGALRPLLPTAYEFSCPSGIRGRVK